MLIIRIILYSYSKAYYTTPLQKDHTKVILLQLFITNIHNTLIYRYLNDIYGAE